MHLLVTLFFSLWLIISFIYIYIPKLLGRLRNSLHRFGFFANWSVYIPNPDKVNSTYVLEYRDKNDQGELGEWIEVSIHELIPTRFIFYIQGRLNSIVSKCVRPLIKEKRAHGTDLTNDSRFVYLCTIICSFEVESSHTFRQIKLDYKNAEGVSLLISESEFFPVQ